MTVLAFRFYRLSTTVSPTGEVTTGREEVRSPIHYDSLDPAPGTEVKVRGFPPCQCPQAPACHAREKEPRTPKPPRPAPAGAAAEPVADMPPAPVLAGLGL
jgi:hypothetical protein